MNKIQFQPEDSEPVRLEKLRRVATDVESTLQQVSSLTRVNRRTQAEIDNDIMPRDFARWAEPYDPRRYGGTGDGTTDDSIAITNAFIVGGDIYLPKGYTFYCPTLTQQTIPGRIRIFGGGTLKGVSGTYLMKPAGGDIIAEDVTFDDWAGIVEGDIADSGTTDLMHFRDCRFLNMAAITIDHERPIDNFIFEHNILDTVTGESIRIGKNDNSAQDTWKRMTLHDNRWTNVTASGTASGCAAILYGLESDISGNYVNGVSVTGTGEAWAFYTKCRRNIITRNHIYNIVGEGSAAQQVGINVKGSERGDTTNPQGFNTIVSLNHVELVGGYGIRAQCDEILILGNTIEESNNSAISLDGIGDHVVVIGNRGYVVDPQDPDSVDRVGIRCGWVGDTVILADNTMRGFMNGILVSVGAGETLSGLLVHDNILDVDPTDGIAIRTSLNATGSLLDAHLHHNKVRAADIGLVFPSTGTRTGMIVENNDLRNATSAIGGTPPTDAIVRDNPGYIAAYEGGTYTPTLTNVTNLDGSTAFQCQYSRSAGIVSVSGKVSVNPTAAGAIELGISLPIASNLGAQEDCAGVAFATGIAGQGGGIRGDATNDRAALVFIAVDLSNQPMYFQFQYQII